MENISAREFAIPDGYEYLSPYVAALFKDAPSYEQNVFVIMRFVPTPPLQAIHKILCSSLSRMGLKPLRADDKSYHHELWSNVCTYMIGCSKAVVIFEDIELREFNPNVALEFGFMRALNKPCLILKERRLPKPPSDIVGHLWREFDSFDPEGSIPPQISKWLVDMNWDPPQHSLPKPVARFVLREATAFHQALEALKVEFALETVYDREAAEVFRSIVGKVAYSGPIFQDKSILFDLAESDPAMADLLAHRRRVASLYLENVLRPLESADDRPADRIRRAHAGVDEVLAEDLELVKRIEAMCSPESGGDMTTEEAS